MNQKKFVLCLVLSICGMVIAGINALILLLALETLFRFSQQISVPSILTSIFATLFYIAIVVMSIALCIRTSVKNGNVKAFLLTLLILYGVCCLLIIIGAIARFSRGFSILSFVIYGGLLALSCVALATNGNAPDAPKPVYAAPAPYAHPVQQFQTTANPSPAPSTLDSKLNELKKMKDLMIISDEQYETAVKKIIMKELEN